MTATQMYNDFLLLANQANNFLFFTSEVAKWLNRAQFQLFNLLAYPEEQKRTIGDSPRFAFESSETEGTALHPFIRVINDFTDQSGWLISPAGLVHKISLSIYSELNSASGLQNDNSILIPCEFSRQNEIASLNQDYFNRPRFEKNNVLDQNLKYYNEIGNVNSTNDPGFVIIPQKRYRYQLKYLVMPRLIQIANASFEAPFIAANNPQVPVVATDVNCQFPENWHYEIVQRAFAEFTKSSPDYQQYQVEAAKVQSGQM